MQRRTLLHAQLKNRSNETEKHEQIATRQLQANTVQSTMSLVTMCKSKRKRNSDYVYSDGTIDPRVMPHRVDISSDGTIDPRVMPQRVDMSSDGTIDPRVMPHRVVVSSDGTIDPRVMPHRVVVSSDGSIEPHRFDMSSDGTSRRRVFRR
jgi:hypothetical protein